jgi:hypothetical protein
MILYIYALNNGKFAVKLMASSGRVIQEGIVDLVLFHYYPQKMKEGTSLFIHVREAEVFIMKREDVEYNVSEYHRKEVEEMFESKKELLVLRVRL